MSGYDRGLGMHAAICRRDFLNGAAIAIGSSLFPAGLAARDVADQDLAGYYPPALTGMRGSHPGSFEIAHRLRDGASWDAENIGEDYDLVVVGGGLSGLAAAWFYRKAAGATGPVLCRAGRGP